MSTTVNWIFFKLANWQYPNSKLECYENNHVKIKDFYRTHFGKHLVC